MHNDGVFVSNKQKHHRENSFIHFRQLDGLVTYIKNVVNIWLQYSRTANSKGNVL